MNQNRTPAGVPTGGEFAAHDRAEGSTALLGPADVDLRPQLAGGHVWASHGGGSEVQIGDLFDSADSLDIYRNDDGSYVASVTYQQDLVQGVAWMLGADPEQADVEEECLHVLNDHSEELAAALSAHGIVAAGYEWDSAEFKAEITLDGTQPITFNGAAAALRQTPAQQKLHELFTTTESELGNDIRRALGVPTTDQTEG
jgi:hypothetical protein